MTISTTPHAELAKPPAVSKLAELRSMLDKMLPQIKLALPRHLDPNRMLRIVLTTVQRTPKLLECTRESLLGCIVTCAQLGLEPDGVLGHAYLIPFWNSKRNATECQLIVGYKGLLKLARQSGEISSVSARVVHAKDVFEYEYGLTEQLRHVPSDEEDPGGPIAAYAIFRLKDGSHHFDVMTSREINRIRDGSQSYKRDKERSPWSEHWEEMAKKTVLRRASKMAPASIEDRMARVALIEQQADAGLPQTLDALDPEVQTDEPAPQALEGTKAQKPPPSTLRQRKELLAAAAAARIGEADILGWFGRAAIDELTRADVDEALAKIRSVTGEVPAEREPGSDDGS